jgi:hypothetical protein
MRFHIVASTGRTATTYIAAVLNRVPGVVACHEGYVGSDKASTPLLPLVNLENAQAYRDPAHAAATVADKRDSAVLAGAIESAGAQTLVDVAYYNAMIGGAILAAHPASRMVAIVRDCEPFVRSSTAIEGEDLLPVGWPAPDKPLTPRERFIGMGRIKPRPGSAEAAEWPGWSATMRNIWLWRETNLALAGYRQTFGDRVAVIRFELLSTDPPEFWARLAAHIGVPPPSSLDDAANGKFTNKKASGYQIGASDTWADCERNFLRVAVDEVESKLGHADESVLRNAVRRR